MKSLSVRLLATPWIAAYQAPPSMGFSRQEYWSGVPLPSPILICIIYIIGKKQQGKRTCHWALVWIFFFLPCFLCTDCCVDIFPSSCESINLTLFSILARISKNLDYEEHPSSRMTFPITLTFDDTIILLWLGRMGNILIFEKVLYCQMHLSKWL